jgi:hypothetical protein
MSESILIQLYRGQMRAMAETVEAWKAEHREAMIARDVEEMVRASLDYPTMMTRLYDSAWNRILANELEDYLKTGEALQDLLSQTVELLHSIRALARSFVEAGHPIERMNQLEDALARLENLKHEIIQCWPWFSQEDIDAGRAEHARGECLELDEAFAQIAGVDKETWRKRVEEHVRSKQS